MEGETPEAKDKVILKECQCCGGWWYPDKEILKNGVSAEACPFCRLKLNEIFGKKRRAKKIIPVEHDWW